MLRKLKIGSRVNLLIVVPLIALFALSVGSVFALNKASLRGAQTQRLLLAQEFRADILPPPASLEDPWLLMNHIVVKTADPKADDAARQEVQAGIQEIEALRKLYYERAAAWKVADLPAELKDTFLTKSVAPAQDFWAIYDGSLLPAIGSNDFTAMANTLRELETPYDTHQAGLAASVALADKEVVDAGNTADSFVSTVTKSLFGTTALLFVLVGLLAFAVRRSILRPIRAMALRARAVATSELAEVVNDIQTLPAGASIPQLQSFSVESNDELAELASSFTSVQSTAVNLAAEQATARRAVSDNLVNVGRRNQNLLERTLGFITDLEQNERDPETLEHLFRLDHLTTRMRRNAQSLLVLAGAEQNRIWKSPVTVGDTVRIALSQVEDFSKVELGAVGDIAVTGAAAPDIAHLLAELIENATSFSPPDARVAVVGRQTANGHQLAIVDNGIGMSESELATANSRLHAKNTFDQASSRMLGLQVVSRLAARNGVMVRLVETAGARGVTAIIEIPAALTASAVSPDRAPNEASHSAPVPSRESSRYQAPVAAPAPAVSVETIRSIVGENTGAFAAPASFSAPVGPPAAFAPPSAQPAEQPVGQPSPTPELVPVPSLANSYMPQPVAASGLTRRVRGAQMPDVGAGVIDHTEAKPTADEVRSRLSNLQRGVNRGRQAGGQNKNGE